MKRLLLILPALFMLVGCFENTDVSFREFQIHVTQRGHDESLDRWIGFLLNIEKDHPEWGGRGRGVIFDEDHSIPTGCVPDMNCFVSLKYPEQLEGVNEVWISSYNRFSHNEVAINASMAEYGFEVVGTRYLELGTEGVLASSVFPVIDGHVRYPTSLECATSQGCPVPAPTFEAWQWVPRIAQWHNYEIQESCPNSTIEDWIFDLNCRK